jgi:Fuc2NAc and GlcNAc transferase
MVLTNMQHLLVIVGITGGVSLVLTGIVRALALRHELLDRPNTRSSHSIPTPRGGGIAVIVAAALGMIIGEVVGLIQAREALTLGFGMLLLGVVGWADDTRGLTPRVRLAIHLCIAFWTVHMLHGLPFVRVGDSSVALGIVGYVLGTLGIVWSINLFNFMDGIDGLAGSQAVLIFGTIAVLLGLRGDWSLATISAVLAASSAAFLVWNWPPAKIFLGDVGSGPLGYLIAGLALASENSQSVPLLAFAIIGGVLICDATVTLLRRFARGDPLTEAHRDHAYQRLTRAWGSHRSVTGWTAAVTLLLAFLGAAGSTDQRLLLPALLLSILLIAALLFAVERRAPM